MSDAHRPLDGTEPSWDLLRQWFEATQRSDAWRDAGLWAIGRLEIHLLGSWAHHVFASEHAPRSRLALAPFHTQAFASLLELAVRLELSATVPGRTKVTKDLERDRTLPRVLHTALALEVITLAVDLEIPAKAEVSYLRNPVDIELDWKETKIPIEAMVVLTDARFRRVDTETDHLHGVALRVSHLVKAQVELHLKELPPNQTEVEQLIEALADEARNGDGVAQREIDYGRITVDTRNGFAPPTMSGPPIGSNGWQRVYQKLLAKTQKPYSERPTWLRADILDGFWQFTPWAQMDLPTKLKVLSNQVRADLAHIETLAGIVLSTGAAWAQGTFTNETSVDPTTGAIALRRLLPIDRVRETMIIPTHPQWLDEAQLWLSLYDSEPDWLDRSLARFELPDVRTILS